jgi:hypothetical protein
MKIINKEEFWDIKPSGPTVSRLSEEHIVSIFRISEYIVEATVKKAAERRLRTVNRFLTSTKLCRIISQKTELFILTDVWL